MHNNNQRVLFAVAFLVLLLAGFVFWLWRLAQAATEALTFF
jgi:hypothetical protein